MTEETPAEPSWAGKGFGYLGPQSEHNKPDYDASGLPRREKQKEYFFNKVDDFRSDFGPTEEKLEESEVQFELPFNVEDKREEVEAYLPPPPPPIDVEPEPEQYAMSFKPIIDQEKFEEWLETVRNVPQATLPVPDPDTPHDSALD